ncbi:MAG: hypothetical protein NC826_02000 [Candidatus Omnitrophica bacterium]|nr:hypothetical protein [Candidatus Omnitrophota bacterium]
MKIETKKFDSTKREIYIEADTEVVKKKFEDVFSRINKKAKIPGFRPGRIPIDVLEKYYGKEAHQQVMQELILQVYNEAIEKEKLEVVDYPDIYDIKLDRNNLSFKAKVEIMPQINFKNYRRIKINYKKIEVSDEEVEQYLNSLAQSRKIDALDDNFARSFGFPDITEMKKSIKAQLFIQKENENRRRIERDILDYLLKETDFKVPSSLVERKLQELLHQAKIELALKGLSKEEVEKKEEGLSQELKREAERLVRLNVIFSHIAKEENIPQQENIFQYVLEFLFREGDWQVVD